MNKKIEGKRLLSGERGLKAQAKKQAEVERAADDLLYEAGFIDPLKLKEPRYYSEIIKEPKPKKNLSQANNTKKKKRRKKKIKKVAKQTDWRKNKPKYATAQWYRENVPLEERRAYIEQKKKREKAQHDKDQADVIAENMKGWRVATDAEAAAAPWVVEGGTNYIKSEITKL